MGLEVVYGCGVGALWVLKVDIYVIINVSSLDIGRGRVYTARHISEMPHDELHSSELAHEVDISF